MLQLLYCLCLQLPHSDWQLNPGNFSSVSFRVSYPGFKVDRITVPWSCWNSKYPSLLTAGTEIAVTVNGVVSRKHVRTTGLIARVVGGFISNSTVNVWGNPQSLKKDGQIVRDQTWDVQVAPGSWRGSSETGEQAPEKLRLGRRTGVGGVLPVCRSLPSNSQRLGTAFELDP